MFMFHRNWRRLHSTIVHFQLRNLLWCPTTTDMYAVHENRVLTYSTATRVLRTVSPDRRGLRGVGREKYSLISHATPQPKHLCMFLPWNPDPRSLKSHLSTRR